MNLQLRPDGGDGMAAGLRFGDGLELKAGVEILGDESPRRLFSERGLRGMDEDFLVKFGTGHHANGYSLPQYKAWGGWVQIKAKDG